jgi:hypothetical protein
VSAGRIATSRRGRRTAGEAVAGGCFEPLLLRCFLALEPFDLAANRGEEAAALGKLAFDRLALGRTLGDDPLLVCARLLECGFALSDLRPEATHLIDDPRVLSRKPVDGVDAIEEVVEARSSEEDLQSRLVLGGVESDQTTLQERLRVREVGARNLESALVQLLGGLDVVELDVGRVPRLDSLAEARVDRLDLSEDLLRLGLFRGDRRGAGGRGEERSRKKNEQAYDSRLTFGRSDQNPPLGTMANTYWGRGAITSAAL